MGKLSVTSDSQELVISNFLKWEATPLTRIRVNAPSGTKIGELVDYPYRSMKLVALSNESGGTVLVQPHNCIVDLKMVNAEKDVLLKMAGDGDLYGISYLALPTGTVASRTVVNTNTNTGGGSSGSGESKNTETVPPVALKRMVTFIGDSTNARIAAGGATVAKGQDFTVVNTAQGGSLAAYALWSMDGSPTYLTFAEDKTIPVKGSGVYVDATLVYGEGVTAFSAHSTTVYLNVDGTEVPGTLSGQTTAVKFYPADTKNTYNVQTGKQYPVYLQRHGSVDGVCVLATSKNDINGANIGNWQTVLERCKTYVQKCYAMVEPQNQKRFIVLTNWADQNYNYETHAFRKTLKESYNSWLKETYGDMVYDIEAYILGSQIWTDLGISPTEEDLASQAAGKLPLSLSSDGGSHLTTTAEVKVAEQIINKAKELGYL